MELAQKQVNQNLKWNRDNLKSKSKNENVV